MSFTPYSQLSPYSETPQTSWYLDLAVIPEIPRYTTDQRITVQQKYHRRPDLLAFDLYGEPKLWWTFSVRNPNLIRDPVFDLEEGLEIFVTQKDQLMSILNG